MNVAKAKALAEQHDNSKAAPTVELHPETPAKKPGQPSNVIALKMAVSPPGDSPAAIEAQDLELNSGIVKRVQLTESLQRSVGNARISLIYDGHIQTKL